MVKFKKEITITVEGESDRDYTEEEIFSKLKIEFIGWWKNNPNWPYGTPCKQLRKLEVKKIELKLN